MLSPGLLITARCVRLYLQPWHYLISLCKNSQIRMSKAGLSLRHSHSLFPFTQFSALMSPPQVISPISSILALFLFLSMYHSLMGFPGGSVVKNPPANAGDAGLISGLGRSPGEGNGNPLQYSCLENPMDKGALWAIVYGIARVGHNLATE